MTETVPLTEYSDWNYVGFLERERIPKPLMKLGIRPHMAGLSLSDTVAELEKVGLDRSRKIVHDWVHKTDIDIDETA